MSVCGVVNVIKNKNNMKYNIEWNMKLINNNRR